MKRLLQPHTIIAFLAGVAAGSLVAMLPPFPDWTMKLPEGSRLREVSSDGRYLVSLVDPKASMPDSVGVIHVWDRVAATEEPMIAVPMPRGSVTFLSLLSPDEKTVALCAYRDEPDWPCDAFLLDLPSGRVAKVQTPRIDHWFFSPEGKLLYVNKGVLRELEGHREVMPSPEAIDELKIHSLDWHRGDYAIYRSEENRRNVESRIYSRLTGQEMGRAKLPGRDMCVHSVSRDGNVLLAEGWGPDQGELEGGDFHVLIDVSAGVVYPWGHGGAIPFPGACPTLSDDGKYLASAVRTEQLEWLQKWRPRAPAWTYQVINWTTGEDSVHFRNIEYLIFSPRAIQIALMRTDGVVEGYAFPVRMPWGLIAGAAAIAACAVWSIAWLVARWRTRKALPAVM
jgi:hypothetical protein